jgi:hypothetical protein
MEVGQTGFHQAETSKSAFNVRLQRMCTHHRAIREKFRLLGKIALSIDSGAVVVVHHFPWTTLNSCGHDLKLLIFGMDDVCVDDEETK